MLSGTEPAFHVPKLAGQRGEAIFSALRDYRSGTRQSAVMQPFVAALSLQDMRDVAAYLAASGPYVPGTEGAGVVAAVCHLQMEPTQTMLFNKVTISSVLA